MPCTECHTPLRRSDSRVSKRVVTNVAASVRERLYNLPRERGEDFQLMLTRYGHERLLYRRGRSPYRDRFIARLAQARLSIQADVGFGDAVTPVPIEIDYPALLSQQKANAGRLTTGMV